jgi:hypothetical protein
LFVAEAEELTETVIVFVKAPEVIVNPWRQLHICSIEH